MADPLRHPPAPAEPAWVQLCRWLWAQQKYVWSVLIMGIIVGVIGNWLTSSTSIFTGTALGTILLWIRDHLLLVILVGIGNYFADRSTHSSSVSDLQQDRPNLIRLLRNEYQRQMSESLQRSAMMGLALQPRTDILLSPALLTSWHMDMPGEASLPTPVSIVQAYDAAGRGLLILGAPGTGKSTLLRELAFELLKRADEDATQPVPVMVNLSSWAVKKPSLTVWMPEQLWDKYRIPPRLSQSLIKENRLLFLLDGLNEVEPSARTKCVEAIEAYLAEQGRLIPIVVCSRSHAYLEQGKRLGLFTVEVQPLTSEQINGYLKEVGRPMSAVRSALGSNPVLRELITTPLMLKVVMLAYRGKTAKNPPQLGSKEEQQRQVVEHYVERMLSGQGNKRSFTSQQTRLWLTWLAQQM